MTKYSFLLYHRDFDAFLSKIQELGVVDIEKENRIVDDEERELLAQINRYGAVVKWLTAIGQPVADVTQAPFSLSAPQMADRAEAIAHEREQADAAIKKAQKEQADVAPWGAFDPGMLERLSRNGVRLRFFSASERAFADEWLQQYPIEVISQTGGNVYFVLVDTAQRFALAGERGAERPAVDVLTGSYAQEIAAADTMSMPSEAVEMRQPQHSAAMLAAEVQRGHERVAALDAELAQLAQHIDVLKAEQTRLINQLSLKEAASSGQKQAGDMLVTLQGWVPQPQADALNSALEADGVIYIAEAAQKDAPAPILFKNGRFARLFEPITRLYSFPIYGELDLTPFFAPFYMMFFGFCLGDAGYGLLFVLLALALRPKASAALKPILSLAIFLGLGAVVFGSLTGTLFGINLAESEWHALQNYRQLFLSQEFMFKFSMMLGVVQIIFGMCVKVVNLTIVLGWKHAISTMGWILLLVSTIVAYAIDGLMAPWHMALMGISAVAILFLNSPGRNPLMNLGLGLWGSYNMVTGLLGDVLSYIRLFALGLSGGMLGGVFNSLAFGMSPDIPVVKQLVVVLILVVGHGINIFMSALGSLVHPVRLTFVEFYKNAGFIGGGKEYQPLRRK
ncbi:MAG: V-type ATP synthase subunit I [Bacteroidales bacterium]|nr:V-type ATP synthase subunit I [Bacteroidales bacterium]